LGINLGIYINPNFFTVNDFNYDEVKNTLTCQAGEIAPHYSKAVYHCKEQKRKRIVFEFSPEQCHLYPAERIKKRRIEVQEKLKRVGRIYVDKLISDEEYNHQLRMLNGEMESLVVPGMNAAAEAGKLIIHLPELWAGANMEEKRNLLLTMLEAVYFDVKQTRSIVAIKPKPPFKPIFQVAVTHEGSGIHIIKNEPSKSESKNSSVFLVETGETSGHDNQVSFGVRCPQIKGRSRAWAQ
jgi:hypothetical protein